MRKLKIIIGLLIIIGLVSSVASGLDVTKEAGVLISPWGTTAVVYYINISNPSENMTNVYVNETYDINLGFGMAEPAPDTGDDQWIIPYLNMTGYANDTWNLVIYLGLHNNTANDTMVENTVRVQSTDDDGKAKAFQYLCIGATKQSNLSIISWNTSYVQYYINVTNCGDFPLQNILVNETWDANMTFVSANYPNVGDTFQLGDIGLSQTKYLIINTTTSYLNTGEKLINGTRHYNNITAKANETSEIYTESYLDSALTEQIGIIYVEGPVDVETIGNSVFNILGILLIISAILVMVGIVYKFGI